jgi:hypothetical protein
MKMVKVKYFRIDTREKDPKYCGYEIINREGEFEFWTNDDRIAFEEKIETAFRQCLGSDLEVCAVGVKRS